MQAWELERELGKAQDKLNAIRTYVEHNKVSLGYPHYLNLKAELDDGDEHSSGE